MSTLKYFSCIVLLALTSRIYSQDQSIYIFDPTGVSTSFQYTLSQLTENSVFVADSLDDSINFYDAAFLFLAGTNQFSEANVNRLISYTSTGKPAYLFSQPAIDSTAAPFWNHIGLYDFVWLLISSLIDSVEGIDSTFAEGIVIDTNFMSDGIPAPAGTLEPILIGLSEGLEINPTFISTVDTLRVILDLYNLIDDENFLREVLVHFELISQEQNVQINFYPQVDTAWIFGGCTGPDLISRNLSSTYTRDSITIEPGPSSYFFYYDSLGNIITVDKYYFIVEDSLNQYDYELWFHPKSWLPFNPVQITFDSVFYFQQNLFDIRLLVKLNGNPIDSLSQLYGAEWGLGVEETGVIPQAFSLYQNYPNPFNPSSVISYQLPISGLVTLTVYDILGNQIATLVNEEKQPGTYEVGFNSSSGFMDLVSGIYFYQLKAENYIETKKMILLK
jgi:hypothetical protein